VGSAHTLLTRRSWESADVTDLVRDQLALDGDSERILIHGPRAFLAPQSTLALALVLHELGTNACKYGCLSARSGRVSIDWVIVGAEPALHMEWTERGGPKIRAPTKRGFGITLIEKSLGGVGGSAQIRFESRGLTCRIRLPLAENGGRDSSASPPVDAAAIPSG